MNFELFIALRYLFARRRQAFIYIISIMSVLGVAIGVAALVIVLGVYNGFTTDIRDKILGANAHLIITGPMQALVPAASNADALAKVIDKIDATPGIVASTPFIYAESMLSSPLGVKGLVLRGIDMSSANNVITMLNKLESGSLAGLKDVEKGLPQGVIIGAELAKRLNLRVDSRVNLLSPAGQKTSTGFTPRIMPFKIVGIFKTGMFEYDNSLGFVSLAASRDLLGLPSDYISGIEAMVTDVYAADKIAEKLRIVLGPLVLVRHWMEMNANLFAALKLEKIGMFIILAMVVLVGSFSIVTSLVMLVMEKTKDIAILMSMGATRQAIRRIFMWQGTIIGLVGTLLGYILGIAIAELLQRYQFIKLPPGVYTIDHLPVLLHWTDIAIVGISALSLCFLATIYPSKQAANLEPVEALRYE